MFLLRLILRQIARRSLRIPLIVSAQCASAFDLSGSAFVISQFRGKIVDRFPGSIWYEGADVVDVELDGGQSEALEVVVDGGAGWVFAEAKESGCGGVDAGAIAPEAIEVVIVFVGFGVIPGGMWMAVSG